MTAAFEKAAEVLNGGGVAVIPTDTVYGLAARPDCAAAVERLYTIKNRAAQKPIALLASDVAAIERDASLRAVGIRGLYPVGEGAGYAGGIVSSAIDGIRTAAHVIDRILSGTNEGRDS